MYVICRPRFDEASEYSFNFCEEIVGKLREKGLSFVDLAGDKAVRAEVERELCKPESSFFIFYDHGNQNELAGNDSNPVIDNENVSLLKGKEVYTLACLWGAKGGAKAYTEGALAVWCYIEEVMFTTQNSDAWKEMFNAGLMFRLEGKTWKECKELAIEIFNKWIAKFNAEGDPWSAMLAQWDRDALRIYALGVDTPESKCAFRKLAIVLFGPKVGWKLTKAFPVSVALFFVGLGILLHDYCHALWQVGGYREILSLQGGYFGAVILTVGFILAYYQLWSALRHA